MDISINAKVSCSDGPYGQSTCVILKPTTQEITHLVVSNESFPENDYLVNLDHVMECTPNRIQLNCSREELAKMPIFNTMEFVPSDLTGFPGRQYMSQIDHFADNTVYLKLNKQQSEELPTIPVQHNRVISDKTMM
jgi:hypothetical protein